LAQVVRRCHPDTVTPAEPNVSEAGAELFVSRYLTDTIKSVHRSLFVVDELKTMNSHSG